MALSLFEFFSEIVLVEAWDDGLWILLLFIEFLLRLDDVHHVVLLLLFLKPFILLDAR